MVVADEIKELINSLMKAKKKFRLYPANNPIYISTVDDVFSKLSSVLQYLDTLTLTIKQYDIYSNSEVVYHNEDKDENLALFFFKDGVREVSFMKNIPRNEVEQFMKVLSSDFETQAVDDDIVTMMWEKDFQYIKYVVDDTVLLGDQSYEQSAADQVKERASNNEEILGAYDEALEQTEMPKTSIIPLSDDDLNNIIKEIHNDPPDKTSAIMSILIEMFSFAEGKGEFEEIVKGIKNTLLYALNLACMDVIIDCLVKIRNAMDKRRHSDEVVSYLRKVDHFINAERFIRHLGEALESGMVIAEDDLKRFSSYFNKRSIPHFITMLGRMQKESSREIAINILSELGKKDISLIAKGLEDERWYVVRNLICILGQIGDTRSIEHLIKIVRHADTRVRKAAVRALGKLGANDVLNVLKDCMSDEEETVRITTVRIIGEIDSPLSKKIILGKINDKNFLDVNFYEKKEVFEALSHWKENDVIDPLMRIIKKQVLFKRAKYDEVKAAAAYCLGLIGDENSVVTLTGLKKSKNKLLRDHVEAAINKIAHG